MSMNDTFVEFMIKRKWGKGEILKALLIVTAAFFVSLILFAFAMATPFVFGIGPISQIATYVIAPLIFAIFYAAYRMISIFDVEFEYALTNGELDVDKIYRKKRRKHVISIDSKAFIEFGKRADEDKTVNNKTEYARVIDACAHSKNFEDYYAVFYKNGQKIKLYFNPTLKMIDIFKVYAPRVVK